MEAKKEIKMNLKFTNRPILSIVISIFILLLGVIAMTQLPITQFPNIAPPEVTVTTKYTGANAETCVKAVVTPLERAINGVPGMSTCHRYRVMMAPALYQ